MKIEDLLLPLLLIVSNGLCKGQSKLEYGTDFLLFPSQDGSQNMVPAYLTKPNETDGDRTLATKADIRFYLYTKNNRETPDELFVNDFECLRKSNFVKNHELKILCHGFAGSYINPFPVDVKNKYLSNIDRPPWTNVIALDWSLLALAPFYIEAVEHVEMVGEEVGKLIKFLVNTKFITLDKIHVIGHSLGAHVGGFAGRFVYDSIGRKLPRITGLDPAAPLIEGTELSINSRTAIFVDIIHTDGEFFGIEAPVGTADFYPNGGLRQRCRLNLFGLCSHYRANEYFLESISSPNTTHIKFASCRCSDCKVRQEPVCYADLFLAGECQCHPATPMGENAGNARPGLYFLNTNVDSPYSQS